MFNASKLGIYLWNLALLYATTLFNLLAYLLWPRNTILCFSSCLQGESGLSSSLLVIFVDLFWRRTFGDNRLKFLWTGCQQSTVAEHWRKLTALAQTNRRQTVVSVFFLSFSSIKMWEGVLIPLFWLSWQIGDKVSCVAILQAWKGLSTELKLLWFHQHFNRQLKTVPVLHMDTGKRTNDCFVMHHQFPSRGRGVQYK